MVENNDIKRETTSTTRKLIFGMPRLGTSIVLGLEGWGTLTLYTVGYGVAPFLVGIALTMGYLSIAAAQFLLGWISDAKYTRIGRRKPYILIFTPLLTISFVFLMLPALILPDMTDKGALFFWLLIWDVIFRFSYAVTTPYQAWMAESFRVEERPKVSQYQNVFNYIGNGVMALFTLLVLTQVLDQINIAPSTIPVEFLIAIFVFGAITWILFYLILFLMPTEPHFRIQTDLLENLKIVVKNKNYLLVVLMQGIAGLGLSMITSVMLVYTEVVLNLSSFEYIFVAVFLLVSIFIFLYLWRKMIKKKGKKKSILLIFIIGAVFLQITYLGLIPMSSGVILGIIFIVGIGGVLGGWFLFPYIMYADLAEDDEKSTGGLKAGIYTGFPSIILNIFQAFGILSLGFILSLPEIYIGTNKFSIGLILWGPIVSVILLVSYMYTSKFVKLDFDWESE